MKILYKRHIQIFLLVVLILFGQRWQSIAQSSMFYVSTDVTQASSHIFQGQQSARLLRIKINTSGSDSALKINKLYFNTKGTTLRKDISSIKLFYTGNTDFSNTPFDIDDTIGKPLAGPDSIFSFSVNRKLLPGANYFWLTYDLKPLAAAGNALDATLDSLVIGGIARYPSIKNPAGKNIIQLYGKYCAIKVIYSNLFFEKLVGITNVKIGYFIDASSADSDKVTFDPAPKALAYRKEKLPVEIRHGQGHNEQIIAWADWNNDGFFDAVTEEVFYTPDSKAGTTYKTSISIPCSATVGKHRVRIASDYYLVGKPSPCQNVQYGEVEEYIIEVLADVNPVAKFSVDTPAYRGAEMLFFNTSNAKGNIKAEWDFNNDGSYELTADTGKYTFTTNGWKKINFRLTQTGCDSTSVRYFTDSVKIISPPRAPSTEFISDKNIAGTGESISLTDISDFGPNSWEWQITPATVNGNSTFIFLENTNKNSQNPVLQFTNSGEYTVSLKTANVIGAGNLEVKHKYLTILQSEFMCSGRDTIRAANGFLYDDGGAESIYTNSKKCFVVIKPKCAESITLNFNSFDVSILNKGFFGSRGGDYIRIYDGIDTLSKRLHDSAGYPYGFQNSFPSNDLILPPPVTATSGTMYILWKSDNLFISEGFKAQWETILKSVPKPKASFSAPDTIYEGHTARYTNTSTGTGLEYFWDVDGDGINDSTTSSASHYFAEDGIYTIRLIISNCGGIDTAYKTVVVIVPDDTPLPNFRAKYTSIFVGDVLPFTDLTTNGPFTWKWTVSSAKFPSGRHIFINSKDSSQHPQIQFLDSGYYSIALTVTNSLGSASLTKTNYIKVIGFCQPAVQNVANDIGISKVELSDIVGNKLIDQESNAGTDPYTYYRAVHPPTLYANGTYTLEVKRNTSFNIIRGAVWIDLNADGDFDDVSEKVITQNAISGTKWTGSFTLPSTVQKGLTRMRVGVALKNYSLTACGTHTIAEFEDYTIALYTDTVKPVITYLGEDTIVVEEGSIYNDPGILAFDNVDGNITSKVKVVNTVNTAIPMYYVVNYTVKDLGGNNVTAQRLVDVIFDTTKPEIKLFDGDSTYVEIYNTYKEPGATATDNVTKSVNVFINGSVNVAKFDTYFVTYSAQDKRGNYSERQRKVVVGDTTAPKIIFPGSDIVKVQLFTSYEDTGVTATDNYWKNISLGKTSDLNTNKIGTYNVIYTAVDGSGNTATRKRIIKVDDYIAPQLIIPVDTMYWEVFKPFKDPAMRMSDNYYNSSDLQLKRTGFVKYNILDTAVLFYHVVDPSGNKSEVRKLIVIVKDLEAPRIVLLGEISINLSRWEKYNEPGYIIYDNFDPNITLEIGGNFTGTDKPGVYSVTYRATDQSGNVSNTTIRMIYVGESTSSIAENSGNKINFDIAPNPANNHLYVKLNEARISNAFVYITDISGKQLLPGLQASSTETIKLDISALANGVYLVNMQSAETRAVQKLVISR